MFAQITTCLILSAVFLFSTVRQIDKKLSLTDASIVVPISRTIKVKGAKKDFKIAFEEELKIKDFIPKKKDSQPSKLKKKEIKFIKVKKEVDIEEELSSTALKHTRKKIATQLDDYSGVHTYQLEKEKLKRSKIVIAQVEYKKFSYKKVASVQNKNDLDKVERISISQSAPERSLPKLKSKKLGRNNGHDSKVVKAFEEKWHDKKEDELVFFDYSDNKKEGMPSEVKPKEAPTKSVESSVNKFAGGTVAASKLPAAIIDAITENFPKQAEESNGDNQEPRSGLKIASSDNPAPTGPVSGQEGEEGPSQFASTDYEYSIQVESFQLMKGKDRVYDYSVSFMDGQLEEGPQGEGRYLFRVSEQRSGLGVRKLMVRSMDHLDTYFDLPVINEDRQISIPQIDRRSFANVLERRKIEDLGGHVLIEVDGKTEDIEIENKKAYKTKIFLNKKLSPVDPWEESFNYILFVGVNPGIQFLTSTTTKQKNVYKLIYVEDQAVYFDLNMYMLEEKSELSFYQEHLLSKKNSRLAIGESDFSNVNFASRNQVEALNKLSVGKSEYLLGSKKLLHYKKSKDPIYISYWDSKKITMPDFDFQTHVIEAFGQADLYTKQCLIHVNLTGQLKRVDMNSRSVDGLIRPRLKALDKDGIFYDSVSGETEKIVILGEDLGFVSVKLEYIDGTSDFLTSYCSSRTYLVEQL